jgi:hypothetical protein
MVLLLAAKRLTIDTLWSQASSVGKKSCIPRPPRIMYPKLRGHAYARNDLAVMCKRTRVQYEYPNISYTCSPHTMVSHDESLPCRSLVRREIQSTWTWHGHGSYNNYMPNVKSYCIRLSRRIHHQMPVFDAASSASP